MVSFEMTRVWEEVKQAKKQLRDASEGVTRDESLSNEVEKLRSELGQVREELTRVRKDGKRDLEAGLGGVRNELEGVRQGVVGETGEDIAKLQEEMESVREKVKGVLKEIEQPRKGARNSDADEAPAKTENIARADCDALEELRSRISVLESGTTGRAIVLKGEVGEGSSLALRTQQIEADLANLRQEMSGLQATVAGVRNHSEKGVESCREEVSNVRKEAEDLRGLVNLQGNVTKQVEALRQELEQGLAGSDARVSKLEREMRASERALAQKLAHLRGADGERLDDVGERLPSPAAEKAEAVASASKRTEDQLARVEERIGMMLGLVSKGQQGTFLENWFLRHVSGFKTPFGLFKTHSDHP